MTNDQSYVVEVNDLTVAYDTKPVLWDIDLKIPRGKLVAVVGPNGAGKTTLIKAILGLLKPISGGVRFIKRDSQTKRAPVVAYVPQSGSVDWDFPATVLDVVLMGRYGKLGWIRRPAKTDIALARRTLEQVGMAAFEKRQISQLSGGQQQRVCLARALVQEADIYFMDEPFKGVDVRTEKIIVELLRQLQQDHKTVVVVHHDLQTVAEYFDWVTLINLSLIASGPVVDVFSESNLQKTYRSTGRLLREAI